MSHSLLLSLANSTMAPAQTSTMVMQALYTPDTLNAFKDHVLVGHQDSSPRHSTHFVDLDAELGTVVPGIKSRNMYGSDSNHPIRESGFPQAIETTVKQRVAVMGSSNMDQNGISNRKQTSFVDIDDEDDDSPRSALLNLENEDATDEYGGPRMQRVIANPFPTMENIAPVVIAGAVANFMFGDYLDQSDLQTKKAKFL